MAKSKAIITPLSGKLGDVVHVDSRYGRHARKASGRGGRKNEPAFKAQHVRTKYLNELASGINTIIKANSDDFKPSRFYEQLLKRLRKEKSDNRFLLLLQLKGMQVNPAYPMNRLALQDTDVKALKGKIVVSLQVTSHATPGKHKADCYYYEVLLLTWEKNKKPANHSRQLSDWVHMNNGRPEFEFEFPIKPGTLHWLLCLRQQLGANENVIGVAATDGMQVIDAGSLDEKDYALLRQREEEKSKQGNGVDKKMDDGVVRVKAKKVV
jgi:hypothetical protein